MIRDEGEHSIDKRKAGRPPFPEVRNEVGIANGFLAETTGRNAGAFQEGFDVFAEGIGRKHEQDFIGLFLRCKRENPTTCL